MKETLTIRAILAYAIQEILKLCFPNHQLTRIEEKVITLVAEQMTGVCCFNKAQFQF